METDFEQNLAVIEEAFIQRKDYAMDRAKLIGKKYADEAELFNRNAGFAADKGNIKKVKITLKRAREAELKAGLIAALIDRFKNTNNFNEAIEARAGRAVGMTPEAALGMKVGRYDPIEKLYRDGQIDNAQYSAAKNIAQLFEMVTCALEARSRNLDGIKTGGNRAFLDLRISERAAYLYQDVYMPWAKVMRELTYIQYREVKGLDGSPELEPRRVDHPANRLELVQAIVIFGASIHVARTTYGFGYPTAIQILQESLDVFVALFSSRSPEPV